MAYGKIIPGLMIDGKPAPYGVVNERAIRATAGIMFVIGIGTFFLIRMLNSYVPLYVTVPVFWLEFFLKTVFGPQYSIFGIVGRWLVKNQQPEWVGAVQKRFAWSIGLTFASTMIILSIGMGVRGWIPLSICMTCLTFMWLESAASICVGCKMYQWLLAKGWMPQPEHKPACPGGVCSMK